mmetsp:Transcript_38254/g.81655  ORF Transcript_38254/g.81655 Transcript_38254/m.81655 type:complete len:269 (-) Transcript_38254:1325-2131(-)
MVCPLKFQPELDGSCGTRTQMGTSSGSDRVAMKSDSESGSSWEGAGGGGAGAAVMPGGGGRPGGCMEIAPGGAVGAWASSVLSLFDGGSSDGTPGCGGGGTPGGGANAGCGGGGGIPGGGGGGAPMGGGGGTPTGGGAPGGGGGCATAAAPAGPCMACSMMRRLASISLLSESTFWSRISASLEPKMSPLACANLLMFDAMSSPATKLVSRCFSRKRRRSSAHFGSRSWMRMCSGMSAMATDLPVMGSMMCVREASPVISFVDTTLGR